MYCFVLHIGIYVNFTNNKRRIDPVLAFNVQIPDQVECLAVFAC